MKIDAIVPDPRRMTRSPDHATSEAAADVVRPKLRQLQREILQAISLDGPMNSRELERLQRFAHCAPSTVRKRVSELYHAGYLDKGERRDGMFTWQLRVDRMGQNAHRSDRK